MDHTAPSAMAPARLSRNILPVILPGLQNPVGCVNQLVSQRFLCSLCLSVPLTGTLYSPLTCQMPARLSTCSTSGALGCPGLAHSTLGAPLLPCDETESTVSSLLLVSPAALQVQ